jgi:hypothetical protein
LGDEHKLLEQIIWNTVRANPAESCLDFIKSSVATDVYEDLPGMVRSKIHDSFLLARRKLYKMNKDWNPNINLATWWITVLL